MAESNRVTIRVAVGSSNPCKIEAVRSAFESTFCARQQEGKDEQQLRQRPLVQIDVTSHSVPSGVSDQPFGDEETKVGAMNRARAAFDAAEAEARGALGSAPPDFAVGLEGGVEEVAASELPGDDATAESNVLWCMAWMAILGSGSERCTMAKADGSDYVPTSGGGEGTAVAKEIWGFGRTGAFALPPKVARLVRGGMELGDADDAVFRRVNSKHGSGTVGILTDGMIDRADYYDHALKLALTPWIRPELYIE